MTALLSRSIQPADATLSTCNGTRSHTVLAVNPALRLAGSGVQPDAAAAWRASSRPCGSSRRCRYPLASRCSAAAVSGNVPGGAHPGCAATQATAPQHSHAPTNQRKHLAIICHTARSPNPVESQRPMMHQEFAAMGEVILLEDEPVLREELGEFLEDLGYATTCAA